MGLQEVDLLRRCIESFPQLRKVLRVAPPRVLSGGIWKHVAESQLVGDVLEIKTAESELVRIRTRRTVSAVRCHRVVQLFTLLRRVFRPERFLRTSWKTDRSRHQSGAFLRTLLQCKGERIAVVTVIEAESPALSARLLSASVLWWDQLCASGGPDILAILIPPSWSTRITHSLGYLRLPIVCYRYSLQKEDMVQIFPCELEGKIVRDAYTMYPIGSACPGELLRLSTDYPELELTFRRNRWELSFNGLTIAWQEVGRRSYFDFFRPRPLNGRIHQARRYIEKAVSIRCFGSPFPSHRLFTYGPEKWLECQLVKCYRRIEPKFREVIYSQVPTWIGGERKVIDLLTVTEEGRLGILEVKTEKDLSLVFQGIDYWDRVLHHLKKGDFYRSGYFPGITLAKKPPLLYLVSPLFEFHRALATYQKYLDRSLVVFCVGINSDWRAGVRLLRKFELGGNQERANL